MPLLHIYVRHQYLQTTWSICKVSPTWLFLNSNEKVTKDRSIQLQVMQCGHCYSPELKCYQTHWFIIHGYINLHITLGIDISIVWVRKQFWTIIVELLWLPSQPDTLISAFSIKFGEKTTLFHSYGASEQTPISIHKDSNMFFQEFPWKTNTADSNRSPSTTDAWLPHCCSPGLKMQTNTLVYHRYISLHFTLVIVSPDETRGYCAFVIVMPPLPP